MRILRFFAGRYPWESALTLACLALGAVMEGVGLSSLLPLLSLVSSGEAGPGRGPAEGQSGLEATVRDAFARIGLEPSYGILIPIIAIAFWTKGGLIVLAKRQVGYTVAHVATDLRLGLLRALLATRWGYYTRQPVGVAANAMATEADRGSLAYHHLAQVLADATQALLYTAIALAISWRVTLGAALAGLLTAVSLNALVRMANRAGKRQTWLLKSLLGRLTDALQAVKLLKATGRETLVGPLLEDDTRRLKKALQRRVLSKEALLALQEPILVTFVLVGLYVALTRLDMAFSSMAVLGLLFASTLGSVNKMQRKYQAMVTESSGLWSLCEMIEQAEAQAEPTGGDAIPTLERGVTLDGVRLAYDGRPVLDGVSLEIPFGEITAIVGPSGAGKTTVVDLITGLVRPDTGAVCIDGVPLAEIDLRRWRQMIGYVPQEMLMLHDSVRVNVTLGDPQVGDADLERALCDAGARDFVAKLPDGVDSSVGERGALLSGGQRQRIAIARALAHRPKLLVLDEATAALDAASEAEVLATVERLRGKTTVVAISHQPALVGIADRIYRIQDGRVVLGDPPAAAGRVD